MCGFAGIVAWDDRARASRELLGRMSAAIAHRGPDGQAVWLNHDREASPDHPQCGLGFARLAILDLDPRAMQPMTDGRRWLVFNGEIYNFRDLRARLSAAEADYVWQTTGDTETLLRAYVVWGENCLDHLNGMFAFAIWDSHDRSLFIARDRMGQKPLYVAALRDSDSSPIRAVAFASELPALFPLPWMDRQVHDESLVNYLRFGSLPHGQTIFRGIIQLLPGHCMRITQAGIQNRMYFRESSNSDKINAGPNSGVDLSLSIRRDRRSNIVATRKLLTQAVARQLISDVPLGCFLSGGVDSSVIAAIMRKQVPPDQPVMTFSIGFDDPRYDETPYAAAVAAHLQTQHRQFIVRPDAAADLPAIAACFGEPFGDSSVLPTYYLSRETRKHVKVALSGDGGDELFAGYERYRALRLTQKLRALPIPWRSVAHFIGAPRGHPKSRLTRLRRLLHSLGNANAQRYSAYLRLMDDALISRLLKKQPETFPPDAIAQKMEIETQARQIIPAAMATDRDFYLPDDVLAKVDRASMLHALEVRSPFMDHDLINFAAGLTTQQLLQSGPKHLLRQAFSADLPDFVFKRKKMGFAIPIGDWLRTNLRSMLHDLLLAKDSFASAKFDLKVIREMIDEHQSEQIDHSQRLYSLLMLELWWKLQKV